MTERADPAAAWRDRPEAGSVLGIRLLLAVARLFGRRALHALMWPVSAYFYLVRRRERAAIRNFLGHVLEHRVRRRDVYRTFLNFARVTADRMFFLTDEAPAIPVRFHDAEAVQRVVDRGGGGLFLAAHMGSFEAARVIGPALGGVALHIVLERGVNLRLIQTLEALNPELAACIIDARQPAVSLGLAIGAALRARHWVGFLADRHRSGDRTARCEFLGGTARFPIGPYLIAGAFRAPLIGIFPRYVGDGYEVFCEVLCEAVQLPRADREAAARALAQRYAERLAFHAREAPHSWFNFFEFWERP